MDVLGGDEIGCGGVDWGEGMGEVEGMGWGESEEGVGEGEGGVGVGEWEV